MRISLGRYEIVIVVMWNPFEIVVAFGPNWEKFDK